MNQEISQYELYQRQLSYEHYYDKKQIRKLIRKELESIEDPVKQDLIGLFAIKQQRLSISAVIQILAEREMLEESAHQIVQKLLELTDEGILDISTDTKKRIYFQSKYLFKEEVLELIQQYQYKLPMLIEPLPINQKGNNRGDGYLLNGSTSLILNQHHTMDIDSKVLDRLNKVPFSINVTLMKNIRNSWKSKDDERTKEKQEEFDKSFDLFERNVFNASAIMINNGNKFYFTHKYDFRGRVYSCGWQLNYQGNNYAKAQLEFSNKQLITEEVKFF